MEDLLPPLVGAVVSGLLAVAVRWGSDDPASGLLSLILACAWLAFVVVLAWTALT